MKKLNGITLGHCKGTQDCETVDFPLPERVVIPMSQTMGAPCDCLVQVGDSVKVGQKIGDSNAFMSAPLHASVSGDVEAITDYLMANGRYCKAVTIKPDGKQTVSEQVAVPEITDKQSFVAAVRESGCCGLGGAGFPTHIKLNYDPVKTPVDTLVINAAECEPYITSDYRELIENPTEVIEGILMVQRLLGIPKARICIESNKPKAIEDMRKKTAEMGAVDVLVLPSSYPQGAEKMIIYSATGRIVAEGELPANQGVMVMNVSTVAFLYRYSQTGMPLISRRITVDGNAVGKPCNMRVPVGTVIEDILNYCEAKDYTKVLAGGPMMGMCVYDTQMSLSKTGNAILAFKDVSSPKTTACIRCGRCIKGCPMNLMPTMLEQAYDRRDIDALKELKVMLCINCGCCSYACPARRPLAEKNQLAKGIIPRT